MASPHQDRVRHPQRNTRVVIQLSTHLRAQIPPGQAEKPALLLVDSVFPVASRLQQARAELQGQVVVELSHRFLKSKEWPLQTSIQNLSRRDTHNSEPNLASTPLVEAERRAVLHGETRLDKTPPVGLASPSGWQMSLFKMRTAGFGLISYS